MGTPNGYGQSMQGGQSAMSGNPSASGMQAPWQTNNGAPQMGTSPNTGNAFGSPMQAPPLGGMTMQAPGMTDATKTGGPGTYWGSAWGANPPTIPGANAGSPPPTTSPLPRPGTDPASDPFASWAGPHPTAGQDPSQTPPPPGASPNWTRMYAQSHPGWNPNTPPASGPAQQPPFTYPWQLPRNPPSPIGTVPGRPGLPTNPVVPNSGGFIRGGTWG